MAVGNLPVHFVVEFHGTIAGTSPWAATLATTPSVVDEGNLNLPGYASAMDAAFANVWSPTLAGLNATDTLYIGCTVRYYRANQTAASGMSIFQHAAALAGSSAGTGAASQALVVSLVTSTPGRTGRGRMYLPATGTLGTGADAHKFPAASLTTLATKLQTFFQAIPTMPFDGSHISDAGVRSVKDGAVRVADTFRIDARPDTQEHRERHLTFTTLSGPAH